VVLPYRHLLSRPAVPQLIVIALVVKLSTPVLSLALLLAVVDRTGSYATAGLVLTAHALTLAVSAPLGGRLADRHAPRRVLAGYLGAHALAYIVTVYALGGSAPAMVGAAALLGATTPPAGSVLRSAWARLVPLESLPAAYAVDNAINELAFIAGPLLVPVLMLGMPSRGVVVAAGAALLIGTAFLLLSSAVRHVPAAGPGGPQGASRLRRLAGPLTHRPTVVLLVIAALGTVAFGCLRIGTVASAATFGSEASAGVLMSLLSAGALAGTLGYGARSGPRSSVRLLVLLSLVEAAVLLGSGTAAGYGTLAVLITAFGVVTGPRDALVPSLLADHAPAHHRTEVFAWLNTSMWTGYGVGTAIAGHLTGPHDGGTAAFTAAAAAALAGAVLAGIGNRPRRPPRSAGSWG
jgi:MFS family permease